MADDAELVELEGWRVRKGREGLARELFAECARRGLPPDYKGRPPLRRLATDVMHSTNPSLLVTVLSQEGLPRLETLQEIEQMLALPLVRQLVGLRLVDRAALEAEAGRPEAMSPAHAQFFTLVARLLSPAAVEALSAFLIAWERQNPPGPP